jgi:hypothetical protein
MQSGEADSRLAHTRRVILGRFRICRLIQSDRHSLPQHIGGHSPPGYEVVVRVERDAAGNWPSWAQEAVERRAARRRPGAGIPFGLGRISQEHGLYMGPVLLYRAEEAGGFNFTGVAARPGDQPVAPPGYVLLPEEPMVLWGEAAEREVALNRLTPLGPFVPDVSWDELPQACMAMDAKH